VDAAFMSLYVHDRGIHALRSGAGGAEVTGARFSGPRGGGIGTLTREQPHLSRT
jgi:hypothetical protein